MAMIDVDGLVRRFGKFEAVRGVSFQVEEGELFGFLGPNGAGKTTTINMLVTMLRPTEGEAHVDGHSVRTQARQVRESIGIVFQEPTVDEALTGWENLKIHADIYDIPMATFRDRAEEVLRMVELQEWRNKLVRNYSGGMKRRLEIAWPPSLSQSPVPGRADPRPRPPEQGRALGLHTRDPEARTNHGLPDHSLHG